MEILDNHLHLRNGVVGSEDEGVDDVVAAVAAGLEAGNLGSGDHDCLACSSSR